MEGDDPTRLSGQTDSVCRKQFHRAYLRLGRFAARSGIALRICKRIQPSRGRHGDRYGISGSVPCQVGEVYRCFSVEASPVFTRCLSANDAESWRKSNIRGTEIWRICVFALPLIGVVSNGILFEFHSISSVISLREFSLRTARESSSRESKRLYAAVRISPLS